MLLTCPTCQSGLEVPDGTTALVRCPACKTVFASAPVQPIRPEPEDEEKPRLVRKPTRRPVEDDDDDDRPRRKKVVTKSKEPTEEEQTENRDFDTSTLDRSPPKRRRRMDDESLSPRERQALREAFGRATWACRLIWISLALFMLSMMIIIGFWSMTSLRVVEPAYLGLAGVIGLTSWLLAAGGVALGLSGPQSSGHWGYGIAAAVAVGIHLLLLFMLISMPSDDPGPGEKMPSPYGPGEKWVAMATRLDVATFYLTAIVYQGTVPASETGFSIVVGFAELIRTTLILLFVSCLARAAGDEEVSHNCTRAAGFASIGPAALALALFLLTAILIASNAGQSDFTKIIFTTIFMGIYAIVAGTVFPGFMAARDAAEVCAEPYKDRSLTL